jgi:hypothetical protein
MAINIVKVAPGKSIYDKKYIRQAMKHAVVPCEKDHHRNLSKYVKKEKK